jgi:hypothetical protein
MVMGSLVLGVVGRNLLMERGGGIAILAVAAMATARAVSRMRSLRIANVRHKGPGGMMPAFEIFLLSRILSSAKTFP